MTKPNQSPGQAKPAPAKAAGVEGEGSYTATRRYNERLRKYIDSEDVEADAEEAKRALEGEEGAELERAERAAKRGPKIEPSKSIG